MTDSRPLSTHRFGPAAPQGDRHFVVAPEYANLLEVAGLDSLAALFSYSQGESLTKPGLASWRERIRLTLTDRGITHTWYMKRFTDPPASARREVRRCGNGARSVAGVEWNWLRDFRDAGIPCAEPVALAEEFRRGRERRSVIIMASVPGRSLEAWARESPMPYREARAPIWAATADLVAKMHSLGCMHRDLYLSHLFFVSSGPNDVAASWRGDSDPLAFDSPTAKAMGHPTSPSDERKGHPVNRQLPIDNRQSRSPLPHPGAPGRYWIDRTPGAPGMGHPVQTFAPAGQSLHVIDLQRVFRPTCCFRRWVVKDLAGLYFSALDLPPRGMCTRTDAVRWLKRYLGVPKLDGSAKRLAYRIIGRTQRLMRRYSKGTD